MLSIVVSFLPALEDIDLGTIFVENPRVSQHYVGWKARQIFLLLLVRGGSVSLDFFS